MSKSAKAVLMKIEEIHLARDQGRSTVTDSLMERITKSSVDLNLQSNQIQIQQDCLLQGQAQLDQRDVFCFCTLRLRGGWGVRLQK